MKASTPSVAARPLRRMPWHYCGHVDDVDTLRESSPAHI